MISLEPRTPHQPEKLRNCQRTIVVLLLLFLASITTLVLYLDLFSAECRSSTDACPEMVQSGFAPYTRHPRRTRLAQASIFEFPHQMRLFDSPPCGNVNGNRARCPFEARVARALLPAAAVPRLPSKSCCHLGQFPNGSLCTSYRKRQDSPP